MPPAKWFALSKLGGLTAGVHSFSWDGSLEDGTNAPDGSYTVAINAKNGGEQLVAQPLRFAMVNGVTRGTDGAKLDLGVAGTSTLDDVRLILSKLGSPD
ncbi:Basal-body rod modification protein flgD [Serratia fonticola]|uniref:Basal-body rod modification protein flgD n=1 Tax=Serratia fonticola TaxID=47917 RepID=A0A4U9WKX6_SERFO|nr:Basal-body rod modification protein flgD [Serratia fonticola]